MHGHLLGDNQGLMHLFFRRFSVFCKEPYVGGIERISPNYDKDPYFN